MGIALNITMFSLVRHIWFEPLHFPDADRLVWLTNYDVETNSEAPVSIFDFTVWRDRADGFESMAAYARQTYAVTGPSVVR